MSSETTSFSPAHAPATRFQVGVALIVLYIVWGSTYLAIRYAVETLPPFLMGSVRYLIAGLLMYGWLRWRGIPTPRRPHWRSALIVGALLLGGGNGGVLWAERTIPSGLAALLVSVVPLWMVFFDWLRPGGRKPSAVTLLGLALGMGGLILLVNPTGASFSSAARSSVGILLISPLLWGLGSIYSRRAPLPASPFMSTAIEMLCGGGVLLTMSVMSGELRGFRLENVSDVSWIGLVYLIVIGALVGFTAYIFLLKHASVAVSSTYAFVNPIVAVLLGWFIADETLSARTAVSGLIILISVGLISWKSDTSGEQGP